MDSGGTYEIIILYLIVMAYAFDHEIAVAVIVKNVVGEGIVCGCLVKANTFQIVGDGVVTQLIVATIQEPEQPCGAICEGVVVDGVVGAVDEDDSEICQNEVCILDSVVVT